jgi:AcrR family transcriptional regulator
MSPRGPASSRNSDRKPGSAGSGTAQRGSLSREAILRAALGVADRDGLGGLTMRKLAAGLGASPMALYRHFRRKEEIVDRLVDLVVGDYDVTNHREADWRDWLRETFRLMHRGLCEHPGIIPLLGGATFSGMNARAVAEEVLAVLRGAGLGEEEAALLFYTLTSYTIGAVGFKSANADPTLDPEEELRQSRLLFELASRTRYPTIVSLAPLLARYSTDQQFVAGLDQILLSLLKRRE